MALIAPTASSPAVPPVLTGPAASPVPTELSGRFDALLLAVAGGGGAGAPAPVVKSVAIDPGPATTFAPELPAAHPTIGAPPPPDIVPDAPDSVAGAKLPAAPPEEGLASLPGIVPTDGGLAPAGSAVKPRLTRKSADEKEVAVSAQVAMPGQAAAPVMPLPVVMSPAIPMGTAAPSHEAPSGHVAPAIARTGEPGSGEAAAMAAAPEMATASPSVSSPPRVEPRAVRAVDGRADDPNPEIVEVHPAPDLALALPSPERTTTTAPSITPTAAPLPASPGASSGNAPRSAADPPSRDMSVTMTLHAVSTGSGATQRLTLKLAPVELGHVSVDIHAPADGPRSVALVFERPETMAMFQQDQRHLAAALDRAGLATDPGQISFSLAPPAPTLPTAVTSPADPFAATAGFSDPGGGQPGRGAAASRAEGPVSLDPVPESAAVVAAYRVGPRTHLDIIA